MDKGDSAEPDAQVLKLTKVLQEMDDAFSSTLHPRKTRVTFVYYQFTNETIKLLKSLFTVHI